MIGVNKVKTYFNVMPCNTGSFPV